MTPNFLISLLLVILGPIFTIKNLQEKNYLIMVMFILITGFHLFKVIKILKNPL